MIRSEADVLVLGAGPIGLYSVFALGQVGLRAVVVDARDELGGQCAALYPEKPVYDIPSRPSVLGAELIADLVAQARPYKPNYNLGQHVTTIAGDETGYEIILSDGARIGAGAVIIATGGGSLGPNRPPIIGLNDYEDSSVFYTVRGPERFRGKHVVIAGGGDSAADWAVVLADIAASVTLIHRRTTFRASPGTMEKIHKLTGEKRLTIVATGSLKGVEGDGGVLRSITVDVGTAELRRLRADALLCFFGLSKDLTAQSTWGIDLHRDGIPVNPVTCETRRRGIFAVGDIAHYPGKLKLILTGFAEAAAAAHAARLHVQPDRPLRFEYSTTKGPPGVQKAIS